MTRVLLILSFVGTVVLANVVTSNWGLVSAGFGLLVPAGTYCAGLALGLRDALQERAGVRWALLAVAVGAGLSFELADYRIALASGVAFLLSEVADLAVYTPLRRKGWRRAVLASNAVGAVVDTLIFLWLAGFPLTTTAVGGQLLVKAVWVTASFLAVAEVVRRALPRQRGMIVEGFAGPGGWSTGLRLAGYTGRAVGFELDESACRTAVAAGHWRVRADVATYPLGHLAGVVDGLIQSPPCQAFSSAGDQLGKVDQPLVFERIAAFAAGRRPPERDWADGRSKLTAEPMRWAVAIRPQWIALEQVPPVLPLWQYTAELLRTLGYRTWCGILSAEQYGVPQTRKRAVLIARRDGLPVGPPTPTHQAYRAGRHLDAAPDLFGEPLPPPVSMAQALGWGLDGRPAWTVTAGGTESGGGVEVFGNADARRLLAEVTKVGRNKWVMDRPATTVCADARLAQPGHRDREGGERQFGEDTVRVTVEEAGVLQSFPADYPWQGTKTKRYEQVGNAVPPLLAAAILAPLVLSTEERDAA